MKIITVYNAKEKDFEHNGLAILDNCIKCEVEEELNGFYGLEIEYPTFDTKSKYLVEDNIIKASTPTGLQLFRIYRKIKNMSSVICYAKHIFYDLLDNFIEDARPTELNGSEALKYILTNAQYKHDFKCYSDIKERNTAYYIRKNPIQALLGDDKNSFLNRWGGELKRDNFNISILNSIGKDNGVTLAYGKNILGIEEELDITDVITKIMPSGLTNADQIFLLPEKYIDSPLINKYPSPKIKHLHFPDIKIGEKNIITLEYAQDLLRDRVKKVLEYEKIDIPKVNYTINFIELSKTEEYKDYKVLEKIKIGDIVTVKHKKLGIDIKQKCVKYVWDSILNRYLEIELGNLKENLKDDIYKINEQIDLVKENLNSTKAEIKITEDRITANVEKKITNVKNETNFIKKDIDDKLKNKDNDIKSVEEKLTKEITKASSKIDQSEDRILHSIDKKIEKEVTSKIKNIDIPSLSDVNDKISKVERKIIEANSKIEQAEDRITHSIDKKITEDVNIKISNVNNKLDSNYNILSKKITENSSKIEQTEDRIVSTVGIKIDEKINGIDDKINEKLNNLNLGNIDERVKKLINDKSIVIDSKIDNFDSKLKNVEDSLKQDLKQANSKIEQTTHNITSTIEEKYNVNDKKIKLINGNIEDLKRLTEIYNNNLDKRLIKANSKIDQTARSITSTVEEKYKPFEIELENLKGTVGTVGKQLIEANSKIDQTARNITSSVEEKYKTLNNKILDSNSKIEQTAKKIVVEVTEELGDVNKVVDTVVDDKIKNVKNDLVNLDKRLIKANSKIDQTARSITSTVEEKYKTLKGEITNAYSRINQTAEAVTAQVYSELGSSEGVVANIIDEKVNGVKGEVQTLKQEIVKSKSDIKQTADAIRSEVQTSYKVKIDDAIKEQFGAVDAKLTYKMEESNSKITQKAESILSTVESSYIDVEDKVKNVKSEIKQTANKISAVAEQVDINGTYFYKDGTIKTEGLRGDLIRLGDGSLDNRNGAMRLRLDDYNYISIQNGTIGFYVNGRRCAEMDDQGVFDVHNGVRVKLGTGSSSGGTVSVIPKFG